jgi:hypothetical protein
MKKLLITAPFGMSLKNLFSTNDFVEEAQKTYQEIHVITPFTEEEITPLVSPEIFDKLRFHRQPIPTESKSQSLASLASSTAFNRYIRSDTDKIKDKSYPKTFAVRCFIFLLTLLAMFVGWKRAYKIAEKIKYQFSFSQEIDSLVSTISPDVILLTGVSFFPDFPFIQSAKTRSVPLIGMIHSWDNLSSKGAIYNSFNKVIVWNEFQKKEILSWYEYSPSQIVIAGMPQLDKLISLEPSLSETKLRHGLGIDSNKKIFSYMTGTPKTIPGEPKIVEKVVDLLNTLTVDWLLILRLHPKARMEDYQFLSANPRVKIELVSSKNVVGRDGRSFGNDEITHYAELLKFSSVLFNIASTASVEACLFDTPVITIAFDEEPKEYFRSTRRFYDYNHVKFLCGFNALHVAHSPEDLLEATKTYLQDPTSDAEKRRRLIESVGYRTDGKSCYRIAVAVSATR